MIAPLQCPACLNAGEILNSFNAEKRAALLSRFSLCFATSGDEGLQSTTETITAISHLLQSEHYWTHQIAPEEFVFLIGALEKIDINTSKNDLIGRISHCFRYLFFLYNHPNYVVKHSTDSISYAITVNLDLFLSQIQDPDRRKILGTKLESVFSSASIEKEALRRSKEEIMRLLSRLSGDNNPITVGDFLGRAYLQLTHEPSRGRKKFLYDQAGFNDAEMDLITNFLQSTEGATDFTLHAPLLRHHLKAAILETSKSKANFEEKRSRLKKGIYYRLLANCPFSCEPPFIKYSRGSVFSELKINQDYYFSGLEPETKERFLRGLEKKKKEAEPIGYIRK